jgi:hypothetical protein
MKSAEWRRWKSANSNILAFLEQNLEDCLLLRITSHRRSTEKEFRKRLQNFWDNRLREHVTAYISVFELHRSDGRPHAHILIRTLLSVGAAIELLGDLIAEHRTAYGLGKYHFRLIDSAERAANYLSKSLLPAARRAAGRVISYSQSVKRAMTTSCQMVSERSRRWGRGVLRLAEALGCEPEQLKDRLGRYWAFQYREQINAMGCQNGNS